MGPFTEGGDWSDKGITGIARFQDRFYKMTTNKSEVKDEKKLKYFLHKTIKKVTEDISEMRFNTALAALMEFTNEISKIGIDDESKKEITKLIAPLAPHLSEEIWEKLGENYSIFDQTWPKYNEEFIKEDEVTLPIQINGKLRGTIKINVSDPKEKILSTAKKVENIEKNIKEKEIVKEIYVQGKIINFIVK